MRFVIGVDDTDNRWSRGTGHRVRCMAKKIMTKGLGQVESIVRHQLLVDPRIPYTSHNSSASVVVNDVNDKEALISCCRKFLNWHAAIGSDVGLCVAEWENVSEEIIRWGRRAKEEVLKNEESHLLASKNNIFLQGLTGRKIGVIGSLAAIGLRVEGNDGRLLWLRNLRETIGNFSSEELFQIMKLDAITDKEGNMIPSDQKIYFGDWSRPVMINKKITLIVEEVKDNVQFKWQCASKDYIKSISR